MNWGGTSCLGFGEAVLAGGRFYAETPSPSSPPAPPSPNQRAENAPDEANAADPRQTLPAALRRRYDVMFKPSSKVTPVALREVRAEHIGKLVTVKGIVTRVTDVRPLMIVAAYTCEECGFEVYQEVTGQTFMPIAECPSARCKQNNSSGQLFPQTRGSKMGKCQASGL